MNLLQLCFQCRVGIVGWIYFDDNCRTWDHSSPYKAHEQKSGQSRNEHCPGGTVIKTFLSKGWLGIHRSYIEFADKQEHAGRKREKHYEHAYLFANMILWVQYLNDNDTNHTPYKSENTTTSVWLWRAASPKTWRMLRSSFASIARLDEGSVIH